jgi:hypothetical protein
MVQSFPKHMNAKAHVCILGNKAVRGGGEGVCTEPWKGLYNTYGPLSSHAKQACQNQEMHRLFLSCILAIL